MIAARALSQLHELPIYLHIYISDRIRFMLNLKLGQVYKWVFSDLFLFIYLYVNRVFTVYSTCQKSTSKISNNRGFKNPNLIILDL